MAVFSFHCQNYKAGALTGIDKHNRRLNKKYFSNSDIDPKRSHLNRIYIEPKQSLYADCKNIINKKVIAYGNRVRKDSNFICECIFSYPEELPLERMDEYNALIIKYMGARLGNKNIIEAVAHCDEGGLPHLHIDIVLITSDNRLSSKTLITRDFIRSIHDKLPLVLNFHNFDVERGTSGNEAGLSAKEYKNKMTNEAKEIDKALNALIKEYNDLTEYYNKLYNSSIELEKQNLLKARELLESKERNR